MSDEKGQELPIKSIMEQFHEFMSDIMDVQEKLNSAEYKKIVDSADRIYKAFQEDIKKTREAHQTMCDKAVEQLIRVIVRDEPWDTLTANRVCEIIERVAHPSTRTGQMAQTPTANKIDVRAVKAIMDREIRYLVADGRKDPAGEAKKRKRD